MFFKYIFFLAFFIASAFCANCGRDIDCLASNAQMTFLGRVVSVEQTNSTFFSAEVQPLCTMHSTIHNTKIDDEEYRRTVTIDGFGTHAGGSCNADSGIVGDTNIFFVWVNASSIHGVARHFGLSDPCYGAFKYTDENANQLNNFIATHDSMVPTPVGEGCPAGAGKASTNGSGTGASGSGTGANGNVGSLNLEENESNAIVRYAISSLTIIASLLAIYFM